MRKTWWMLALVIIALAACTEKRDTLMSGPDPGKTPDVIHDGGDLVTRVYESTNPFAKRELARLLRTDRVQHEIQRFAAAGYAYRADDSFVAEGTSADGRTLELALLALGAVEGSAGALHETAVHLFAYARAGGVMVIPTRLVPGSEAGPWDEHVTGNVWFGLADAGPGDTFGGTAAAAAINLKRYVACVATGTAAGAAGCAFRCVFTGPGYWHCLGICTGGAAIGAAIGCLINEL
jgi:hypothetical protein